MGAPIPSRFVVIERVRKDITKAIIKEHIEPKNNNIEVRDLKTMSLGRTTYTSFLLEVSCLHLAKVMHESFWEVGMRVRMFRGNIQKTEDREGEVQMIFRTGIRGRNRVSV